MTLLIETQFFGPISAWASLSQWKEIKLEAHEHWQKMSFRNRCQILTQGGVKYLTLPVKGGRNQHGRVDEMELETGIKWKRENWRTLESAYNSSPYFFHYAPSLQALLMEEASRLFLFNLQCMEWMVNRLGWFGKISQTISFEKVANQDGVVDRRGKFMPRNRAEYRLPSYPQSFGTQFESNLSILDLLFQMGPQSLPYLDGLLSGSQSLPIRSC
jgi:hypothetical protein